MRARLLTVAMMVAWGPPALRAQALALADWAPASAAALPFAAGEELVYRAAIGRFGNAGRATMRVEDGETIRGHATLLLRFDMQGRVLGMRVEDRTRSWLDPASMAALRFRKQERSPLAARAEDVEIDPARGWWQARGGGGRLTADAPLDELSFIYFIRTLPLADGEEYRFDRHFDAARNPVVVRAVGRERITVPAGTFDAVVVEMRVRDAKRFGGSGVVRFFLSDDARRIPLRIESSVPVAGRTVLTLESMSAAPAPAAP